MFFNPKYAALGTMFLLALTRAEDTRCNNGPWTDVYQIGGAEGDVFCHTRYDLGAVITGMEVWASSHQVEAIQFYYSDGTDSGRIGKENDVKEHARLDWDHSKGQLVQQVELWGNGKASALGRVHLRLNTGDDLSVGKNTDGQNVFKHETHAGVMLGAVGAASDKVNRLGFLFLKSEIDGVTMTDVEFEDTVEALMSKNDNGLKTVAVDDANFHNNNNDGSNMTYTFGKSIDKEESKTWTHSATHTFGITHDVEISGKILGIGATTKWGLKYEYSSQETTSDTKSEKVTLTYGTGGILKPGQVVFCRATAMTGAYDGSYHSTLNLLLKDGTTYSFKEEGTMKQIAWSSANATCQSDPFPPMGSAKRAVEFLA